jgi:uncharacterized protein (TIGR03118 family)
MNTQFKPKHLIAILAAAGMVTTLVACGGGGGDSNPVASAPASTAPTTPTTPTTPTVTGTIFAGTSLVTDTGPVGITPGGGATGYAAVAPGTGGHVDANLINPWGLAFNPAANGFSWLANEGTSTSTLYDGDGVQQSLIVKLTPTASGAAIKPTGIVFNGTQDFKVSAGGVTGTGIFIFAALSGTISAWSPTVAGGTATVVAVDNSAAGAVYKGLAIGSVSGVNYIYATDFHNKRVDVFDANFKPVTLPGGFKDANLPANYVPFGIQTIGTNIFVSYAPVDSTGAEMFGAGLGIVDEFDTSGNLVKELVLPGGALNNPWGMAMAPANFGIFSNDLLVGNFGDGKINAFDPATGKLVGTISDSTGTPLSYAGLWGIAFGNGQSNQPTNTLFYAAGIGGGAHGQYGRVDVTN